MKFCPECKTKNSDNNDVCKKCGAVIKDAVIVTLDEHDTKIPGLEEDKETGEEEREE